MFINSVSNISIIKVISANRLLDSPVGLTTYRCNRESWALILKIKGRTIYNVNGKKVLSDNLHPVILPKGCSYSWTCIESGECQIIEFDSPNTANTFMSFDIKDNSIITGNFLKIEKSMSSKKSYSMPECTYYLYEMILFLLKSITIGHSHPKKYDILKPAVNYITENYFDSNITNDYLSAKCNISTVYFRKTFTSAYGISPIRYLNNFRIEKAKSILLSDFDTIEQVAFSVGYNSIYHFSKAFKLHTGFNPSEYAKASRT